MAPWGELPMAITHGRIVRLIFKMYGMAV